jgi:serine protease Do
VRELDAENAARLKVTGVLVAEVFDRTPAAKAGLKVGDIMTAVAGKAVKNADMLQRVVAAMPLDQAADIDVVRDGQPMRLTVVIEEQPAEYGLPPNGSRPR